MLHVYDIPLFVSCSFVFCLFICLFRCLLFAVCSGYKSTLGENIYSRLCLVEWHWGGGNLRFPWLQWLFRQIDENKRITTCCWWKKSCTTWYVLFLVNNEKKLPTSTGAKFLPSTVINSMKLVKLTKKTLYFSKWSAWMVGFCERNRFTAVPTASLSKFLRWKKLCHWAESIFMPSWYQLTWKMWA